MPIFVVVVFLTQFLCQAICTQRPEGTQVIVGSMNMGYISDTARNRTHNLFRPKREPVPLGHNDGLMMRSLARPTLLYWYCIYAFLANCRKGACGYVQCWKSSVFSSFSNTEKVLLGSFILGGRQFQAVGPA